MKCYFKQDDVVRKKADELEEKYEVRRTSIGDATILNRGYVKKEYFYIQNLNEFATEAGIDEDDDGRILFTLDSSGVVSLK